jgi:hypothetical protein
MNKLFFPIFLLVLSLIIIAISNNSELQRPYLPVITKIQSFFGISQETEAEIEESNKQIIRIKNSDVNSTSPFSSPQTTTQPKTATPQATPTPTVAPVVTPMPTSTPTTSEPTAPSSSDDEDTKKGGSKKIFGSG